MANTILHKRSTTAGSVPTAAQLAAGELALNLADEKVFMENASGTVVEVSYRDARARAAISVSGDLSYDSATGVISYTEPTMYADSDARAAISVTDSGGDGSLSYDNSTGVITYTGPSAAEVRAHFSAGTGVSISSGSISIGQAVGTTDNVTFNNVTVNGTLTSDDITSTNISVAGNATITGNLTVQGTTTTVDSTTVAIGDNIIVLNKDEAGTPSLDAGIEVERGTSTNVTLVWDETNDRWTVGSQNFVAGTFIGNLTGNVTGNADTATKWATGRTITLTGDVTGTSGTFDGSGNLSFATTIAANSVALGTDTTGNYMVNVTGSNGVSVSHTQGEGSTAALSLSGSYTGTWAVTGGITATGEITAYFSDERLKTNVAPITGALAKVEAIRGVEFDPNQTALDLGVVNERQVGVLAQEVEAVMPLLVTNSAFEGYKTVRYDKITALLIEAVKELSAKVASLEAQLQK